MHGDTYGVTLNGVRTTEFVNLDEARGQSSAENPASGYVGLQAHSGRVAFRNIRVKPLPATAIINTPVAAVAAIAEPAAGAPRRSRRRDDGFRNDRLGLGRPFISGRSRSRRA